MKVTMRFEGGRELERALGELGTLFRRRKAARETLLEAAEPIRAVAENAAPVRTGGKEKRFKRAGDPDGVQSGVRGRGALKRHVSIGTRLSRRQSMQNRAGKMPVEVYVGTRDRVGRLEEFGTRFAAAQPFMRPAWDAEGGQAALDRISEGLWRHIQRQAMLQEKAARRAVRRAR